MRTGIVPRHLGIIAVSSGGVGTTALMRFLERFIPVNSSHDRDGLKHLDVPPVNLNPGLKSIYIFGNPVLAAASLFRRNLQVEASIKALRNHPAVRPVPEGMTLDEYASEGVDRFLFREHLWNWRERYRPYPTLFVRYDKIWDSLDTILPYAGIPLAEKGAFPARRPRAARMDALNPETLARLQELYGGFARELEEMQDCFLVEAKPGMGRLLFALKNLPDILRERRFVAARERARIARARAKKAEKARTAPVR